MIKFFPPDDLRGEIMVPPAKKLEDLIHLAELCVDLLQQNEEHYAEVTFRCSIGRAGFSLRVHLYFHMVQPPGVATQTHLISIWDAARRVAPHPRVTLEKFPA